MMYDKRFCKWLKDQTICGNCMYGNWDIIPETDVAVEIYFHCVVDEGGVNEPILQNDVNPHGLCYYYTPKQ